MYVSEENGSWTLNLACVISFPYSVRKPAAQGAAACRDLRREDPTYACWLKHYRLPTLTRHRLTLLLVRFFSHHP
jgi:hypothetical protein